MRYLILLFIFTLCNIQAEDKYDLDFYKSIRLNDLTQNKPDSEIKFNKTTGEFTLSKELTKYYTDIEEAYKIQNELIIKLVNQNIGFIYLLQEKDITISLYESKDIKSKELIEHLEKRIVSFGVIEKQLTFYKSAFSINIGINVFSIFGTLAFMGGYYVANLN